LCIIGGTLRGGIEHMIIIHGSSADGKPGIVEQFRHRVAKIICLQIRKL
jgi:hypothetical protein